MARPALYVCLMNDEGWKRILGRLAADGVDLGPALDAGELKNIHQPAAEGGEPGPDRGQGLMECPDPLQGEP